jgi:Flp pilus assembly protein TadB
MWTLLQNVAAMLLGVLLFPVIAGTALAVLYWWHVRRSPPRTKDVDLEELDRDIAYLKARATARDTAAKDRRLGRRFLRRTLAGTATVFGALFAAPLVFALKLELTPTKPRSRGR